MLLFNMSAPQPLGELYTFDSRKATFEHTDLLKSAGSDFKLRGP
jgi:hypothetical protein